MGDSVGVMASEIAEFLQAELMGEDVPISGVCAASDVDAQKMTFISYQTAPTWVESRKDALYIIPLGFNFSSPHISSANPRLTFIKAVNYFFPYLGRAVWPTTEIDRIIKDWSDPRKWNQVKSSEVRQGAVVTNAVTLGSECFIKSGAVIGEEGFGFEYDEAGIPLRFPHIGRVIIGDDVEVGANTVICRGALSDTVIGNHVKIDDRVFIAHNVQIGDCSLIIAGAEISGSVKIGRNVWVGPNACIKEKLTIGDNSLIGIGSVVIRDVPANSVVAGNPARFLRKRFLDMN